MVTWQRCSLLSNPSDSVTVVTAVHQSRIGTETNWSSSNSGGVSVFLVGIMITSLPLVARTCGFSDSLTPNACGESLPDEAFTQCSQPLVSTGFNRKCKTNKWMNSGKAKEKLKKHRIKRCDRWAEFKDLSATLRDGLRDDLSPAALSDWEAHPQRSVSSLSDSRIPVVC